MAPVVQALESRPDAVESRVCVTAQHRHMLDQVLGLFRIRPARDLDLMRNGQSPTAVFGRVLERLPQVLREERPDWVVVQGDTTTTAATATAARYEGVPVAHVEAGLRTFDKSQPFPEEVNRLITTAASDLHFPPTRRARRHLLDEGIEPERVVVTGNTVIDALLHTVRGLNGSPEGNDLLKGIPDGARMVLVTAHRRESFGAPHEEVCRAIRDLAVRYAGDVRIVYPVHLNSRASSVARNVLQSAPWVTLTEPVDYRTLVRLMARAEIVLTDSGGIQEEAPSLGKPVLVLRDVTERPEGIEAGTARLVGTSRERIVGETVNLLENSEAYARAAQVVHLYGDGHAAERIVSTLLGEPTPEWEPVEHRPGAGTAVAP
jgi:UDP-N-acetylglucosamine 2-epimerase (non-hydrolysing)